MNTSQLSSYAPAARKAFIAAVSTQASKLGVTASGIAEASQQGDVLIIAGQAFPRSVADARQKLLERVSSLGFQQAMEAAAYTWFNRFIAIRYMELHGYLDHGYRVLSHPDSGKGESQPEILDHAADIELPGLDQQKAIELKLDGTKDEELYRLLLLAQCNALHQSMPFLFEAIGAADELLLPANLLHTDSLSNELVSGIDQEAWEQIEIIGWLYQFYISEKKDQVIGKVVKSEDIPAATQLFTPNWIVKYMVQNSLGAQWMATYPQSPLKGQMEYYIEPAEQTDEVNAQLAAITPTSLNPEELTLIDPASGSGHILVEAYDLFKAIYLERGYRLRDIPQLILEKNLFALDIDERAAQLSGFALMMKGRADDRRIFNREIKPNVMALVNSTYFDVERLDQGLKLSDYGLTSTDLTELKQLFEHATTFGSLIQMPEKLVDKLSALKQLGEVTNADLFVSESLKSLAALVKQAELLETQYDSVVVNPPYMGGKGMNSLVKKFAKDNFPAAKSDLFACFISRSYTFTKDAGYNAMVTMQSWMFLAAFRELRLMLRNQYFLQSLLHIGYNSFPSLNSKVALAAAFTHRKAVSPQYRSSFFDLNSAPQSANKNEVFLSLNKNLRFDIASAELDSLPDGALAYWLPRNLVHAFTKHTNFGVRMEVRGGMTTADNSKFVRIWSEVSASEIQNTPNTQGKWKPYNKGGPYRKWYGNRNWIVLWEDSGQQIKATGKAAVRSEELYGKDMIGWTDVGGMVKQGSQLGVRYYGAGFLFDASGPAIFPHNETDRKLALGFLGSEPAAIILKSINPTLHVQPSNIACLPWVELAKEEISDICECVDTLVHISMTDWDYYETSWDFKENPLVSSTIEHTSNLEKTLTIHQLLTEKLSRQALQAEERINEIYIKALAVEDSISHKMNIKNIALLSNSRFTYRSHVNEAIQDINHRGARMEELLSYAIGCMMGRYSLNEPGLIYANSGNEDFDPNRYTTFPADDDGIVPLTDTDWFEDDACNRTIEFITKSWQAEQLEANLAFLADNLSPKEGEPARDTLRRYLCDNFYKKHLQTYKKRPIYWLFTSGKQKGFQCLVYLHRYNEGTLSRMRSEYVIPLLGKMASRLEKLTGDIDAATSTAQAKSLEKERAKLDKQQTEVIAYDEKLRHYADMRVSLDLDDGVKSNYGKFGNLLAEVKAIHGEKAETI